MLRGSGIISTGCAGTRAPSAPVCSCGSGQAAAAKGRSASGLGGHGSRWSLSCLGHPGLGAASGHLRRPAFCLPPCTLRGSHSCGLQVTQPHRLPVPGRGLGCAHCASGPVSGLASHVCMRVWEPVYLRFFGCTPVLQAARPLADPGWAHLSRAAREADWGRRPARSVGPAPACLGSGQGVQEPRGTLAGWARHCWGLP